MALAGKKPKQKSMTFEYEGCQRDCGLHGWTETKP
jgi:hypothetical protein